MEEQDTFVLGHKRRKMYSKLAATKLHKLSLLPAHFAFFEFELFVWDI